MVNFGTLGSLGIDLFANVARFESDMGRAQRVAEQRSRQIQQTVSRVSAAVAGAAVVAGGVAAIAVKKAIDNSDALSKLSQKVGVSIEALAGLELAGTLSGVENIDGALKKLSKTAVEAKDANSTSGRAFKALGVDIRDANGQIKANDQLRSTLSGSAMSTAMGSSFPPGVSLSESASVSSFSVLRLAAMTVRSRSSAASQSAPPMPAREPTPAMTTQGSRCASDLLMCFLPVFSCGPNLDIE